MSPRVRIPLSPCPTSLKTYIFTSCEKEITNGMQSTNLYTNSNKTDDPVIDYYSPYGSISIAPENYIQKHSECSAPLGVYLFTPEYGPYAGTTTEIYRYSSPTMIEGPCGDNFNLEWSPSTNGNGETYIGCPRKGSDCEKTSGPTGCIFIKCDS